MSFSLFIKTASYLTNILRIWRRWVASDGLTLQKNFITRECFQDVCLSTHAAVLQIKACRDFTSQYPVLLSKTGSDCCEDFFSENASLIKNKHTYSLSDMQQNCSAMNRLQQLRADPQKDTKSRKTSGTRKTVFLMWIIIQI